MNASALSKYLFGALKCRDFSHPPVGTEFPGFTDCTSQIEGLGFFPGGDGLWKEPGHRQPNDEGPKPIMVLGNNFGTKSYLGGLVFEESRGKGTWRGLLSALEQARVPLELCFFTNAYPSLLLSGGNTVRIKPRKLADSYIKECRAFFLDQIRTMQPRLILTLGKASPFVLGEPLLRQAGWLNFLDDRTGEIRRFSHLDHAERASVGAMRIDGLEQPLSILSLLHPSDRGRNLKHRALPMPTSEPSGDPEVWLLKTVLEEVGLNR